MTLSPLLWDQACIFPLIRFLEKKEKEISHNQTIRWFLSWFLICSFSPMHFFTHTPTHTVTPTHADTQTLTRSLSLCFSYIDTFSFYHRHSFSLSLEYWEIVLSPTNMYALSFTLSFSLEFSHSLFLNPSYSHKHTLSLFLLHILKPLLFIGC